MHFVYGTEPTPNPNRIASEILLNSKCPKHQYMKMLSHNELKAFHPPNKIYLLALRLFKGRW